MKKRQKALQIIEVVPSPASLHGTISQQDLQAVLESTRDGIMIVDQEKNIVFLNPASEKIIGWKREEVMGKRCSDVVHCHTCTGMGFHTSLCPLLEMMREGKERKDPVEMLITTKAGEERWIEVHYAAIRDVQGHFRYGVSSFRDITERKWFEEAVVKAKTLATLGEFASELAHEVKNPLNAIDLQFLLLQRELQKDPSHARPEIWEIVGVLKEEVTRLNNLVEDFLSFAKSGSLQLQTCDMRVLVEELITLITSQAHRHQVKIVSRLAEQLPLVRIDRSKIKQAILNLMINAIEAMPDGGQLTLILEHVESQIRIVVIDTGSGIPAEVQQKAFELFYSTKEGGTGIGLSIAQNILQAHGGSLQFDTSPQGTQFVAILPVSQELEYTTAMDKQIPPTPTLIESRIYE
jgi:PAS domain S-box-containing protein